MKVKLLTDGDFKGIRYAENFNWEMEFEAQYDEGSSEDNPVAVIISLTELVKGGYDLSAGFMGDIPEDYCIEGKFCTFFLGSTWFVQEATVVSK